MRISVNTTLDKDLYKSIQILALQLSTQDKKMYANDLIEEGMKIILDKYLNKDKDINRGIK